MKKVILSVLVVGSLLATSCKKAKKAGNELKESTENVVNKTTEATKNAANEVVDATKKAVEKTGEKVEEVGKKIEEAVIDTKTEQAIAVAKEMGIEIPTFKKPELTQNLANYAVYAKDYLATKGNVTEIAKLAPKGKELLTKGKELLNGLDAETTKKYTAVLNAIQSKMAPSK